MRKLLAWAVVAFIGVALYSSLTKKSADPATGAVATAPAPQKSLPSSTAPPPRERSAKQEECSKRIEKAEKAGIIRGFGFDGGTFAVRVDEAIWTMSDYAVKVGIAATFNCAIAGDDKQLAEIQFRSHRTNKTIGTWSWGKLTVP